MVRGRRNVCRGRKAIFFTFDALVAMMAVGTLMFLIFQNLQNENSQTLSQGNLYLVSEGAMASLEKDGALSDIANSTRIPYEMTVAPSALCWSIQLVRDDGYLLSSSAKAGCACAVGSVYSRRAVVFRNATSVVYSTGIGRFCFA